MRELCLVQSAFPTVLKQLPSSRSRLFHSHATFCNGIRVAFIAGRDATSHEFSNRQRPEFGEYA